MRTLVAFLLIFCVSAHAQDAAPQPAAAPPAAVPPTAPAPTAGSFTITFDAAVQPEAFTGRVYIAFNKDVTCTPRCSCPPANSSGSSICVAM